MRVQLLLATKVVRAVKLLRYDDNLLAVQHVVDDVVEKRANVWSSGFARFSGAQMYGN